MYVERGQKNYNDRNVGNKVKDVCVYVGMQGNNKKIVFIVQILIIVYWNIYEIFIDLFWYCKKM